MNKSNWRWNTDYRGTKLKRLWNDDYPRKNDFELPQLVTPQQIKRIEKLGPGIISFLYIKLLNLLN